MIKKYLHQTGACLLAAALALSAAAGCAEEKTVPVQPTPVTEEAGYSEIETLLEMNEQLGDLEGMNLEEITDVLTNGAMKEYLNEKAGFTMLYPAAFEWDESGEMAVSEDGKAVLQIESIPNGGEKYLEKLAEMMKKSTPDGQADYFPESSQLMLKRTDQQTGMVSVDLYLETGAWIHHAYMVYPADQEKTYEPYIPYMLNSMTSNESEQG